jgi:hypothetical protein
MIEIMEFISCTNIQECQLCIMIGGDRSAHMAVGTNISATKTV